MRKLSTRERQGRKIARARKTRKWVRRATIQATAVLGLLVAVFTASTLWWSYDFGISAMCERAWAGTLGGASRTMGLSVRNVLVEGRQRTSLELIKEATALRKGQPLLASDLAGMQQRLEEIGWVKRAVIRRQLPDTLVIDITERTPAALWQHKGELYLVDEEGAVITQEGLDAYAGLPIMVGDQAAESARSILSELASKPDLFRQVASAIFVGGRRWNVRFNNGIEVKLPEHDPGKAWEYLAELETSRQILSRDIEAVDLRFPDRIYIRLSDQAAENLRKPGKMPGEDT